MQVVRRVFFFLVNINYFLLKFEFIKSHIGVHFMATEA